MRMLLRQRPIAWSILVFSASVALLAAAGTQHQQQSSFLPSNFNDDTFASENPSPPSRRCTSKYHSKNYGSDAGSDDCLRVLREEHRVGPLPWAAWQEPIKESFAGHIPIRSWQQDGYHGETSMFYWYFPASNPKVKDPPLIIWLQGGPGSSSMIGLFFENGPILVNEHMRLERKPFSWSEEYSVLYIDQPVGTGYSYVTRLHDSDNQEVTDPATVQKILAQLEEELQDDQMNEEEFFRTLTAEGMDSAAKFAAILMKKTRNKVPLYSKGYVKDERGVAADLLVFLDQFYERYPEVQKADLYLTGESYAGKYIPALAYGILESNKGRRHHHEDNDEDDEDEDVKNAKGLTTPQIFPLKGIALGNSLTDPLTQIQVHADHAYYMGLVTRSQADQMRALQDQAVRDAEKGRFLDSNSRRVDVFDLFMNATGGLNWYDVRKGSIPNDWGRMEAFMNLDHVKDSLNVFGPRTSFLKQQGVSRSEIKRIQKGRANTKYFKDLTVIKTMAGDIMRSATWMVSSLLQQGINVLTFQGIFDFRDGVAGSSSWIEGLDWEGQEEFQNAERELWMNEGKLAGYVSQVPGLLRVTVLGAGHLAPMDQGANALAMLKSFVEDSKLPSTTVDEAQELAVAHVI